MSSSNGSQPMPTFSISTLGCRVNQYESEAICELLQKAGFRKTAFGTPCDLVLLNSCTVTAESDRKSRQMIRRGLRSGARYGIVVGCAAQYDPAAFTAIQGVGAVIGCRDKTAVVDAAIRLLQNGIPKDGPIVQCDSVADAPYTKMSMEHFPRTRAYIKIEDGCNGTCAYCVIPKVRGPVRSRPAEEILCEVRALAASGCREVVLTGIETAAYGSEWIRTCNDIPETPALSGRYAPLMELLSEVDHIPGIERIRLGSLDPAIMRSEFLDFYASLRHGMPHLHLSMQSGCSRTLKSMHRRYVAEQIAHEIREARQKFPSLQLSADVITGFPGETEEDFGETLRFFSENRFLHLHIFPYSLRCGTEAADLPHQVPEHIRAERAARLTAQQQLIQTAILQKVTDEKRPLSVLFESVKGDWTIGHSAEMIEVHTKASNLRGRMAYVIPSLAENGYLLGNVMENPAN